MNLEQERKNLERRDAEWSALDGTPATMAAENEVLMEGPDGGTMVLRGRALTVWRKDADREWRCTYDIWNAPPG